MAWGRGVGVGLERNTERWSNAVVVRWCWICRSYTQIDYAYLTTFQPVIRCNIHLPPSLPCNVHQFFIFYQYVDDFPIVNQKHREVVERLSQCLSIILSLIMVRLLRKVMFIKYKWRCTNSANMLLFSDSICVSSILYSLVNLKRQQGLFQLPALAHKRQFVMTGQVIPVAAPPQVDLVFFSTTIVWFPAVPFGVGEHWSICPAPGSVGLISTCPNHFSTSNRSYLAIFSQTLWKWNMLTQCINNIKIT